MLCSKPYRPPSGGMEFRCGKCLPCRINRRKEWTCRALLEAMTHQENSFLTLTYSEETYPPDGSLSVPVVQNFLKRWRWKFGPVRYMMVGEYGRLHLRPHYHALFFGANPSQSDVEEAWGLGHVLVGNLTVQSAQYVAGYVAKKFISTVATGQSLKPEFLRCSLNPGIGAPALDMLEGLHYTDYGARYLSEHRDVMRVVRIGGRLFPIGNYLTRKLRERIGLPSSDPARLSRISEEMQVIRSHPDLLDELERKREGSRRAAQSWVALSRSKGKI